MYKVMISKKLASVLRQGLVKTASDAEHWDSLSYEEQKDYLKRHPKSKKRVTKSPEPKVEKQETNDNGYNSMSIEDIQKSIETFQKANESQDSKTSTKEFKKLYFNFIPLIASTVKKVVGSRQISKDDEEDLKQQANIIFAKAISMADPSNKGVIQYINTSLYKQLIGKSREIFRNTVTIGPKERKAQREILNYIHSYYKKHGEMPTDYDQMARDINEDENTKTTFLTPDLIRDLLQSGSISIEEELGNDESDSGRKMEEVIGPEQLDSEVSGGFSSPEEDTIKSELKDTIMKSIDAIPDEEQRQVLKLFHGFDSEHPEAEGNYNEIAKIINKPRKTTRRILDRATATLRSMKDIQKLRNAGELLSFMKNASTHIKLIYVPENFSKIGSRTYMIDQFSIKKFGSQLVCSCGETNCFHKDYVKSIK